MLFEPIELKDQKARIVVVGVGGGGGNALNRMIGDGMASVDFIAINTDAQDLEVNNSQIKLQIGRELTKGLGAGADSDAGGRTCTGGGCTVGGCTAGGCTGGDSCSGSDSDSTVLG